MALVTPLAHRFAKELTLPLKDRRITDLAKILPELGQVHCFDCSEIYDSINRMINEEQAVATAVALLPQTFIPCEIAWLEVDRQIINDGPPGAGDKTALIVWMEKDTFYVSIAASHREVSGYPYSHTIGSLRPNPTSPAGLDVGITKGLDGSTSEAQALLFLCASIAILMLDIINQPTLCRLVTHQPHRGLERALLRAGVGRYPLLAWQEIVITHEDFGDEDEAVAHLTGRKCLHFVRGHRRQYRDGRLTQVAHHWRGDPALGIKRTRYKVAP